MSTTIDERVVEMRFDNKQFESNVATSMSTLDKLKQKLNLPSASKGLEDLGAAAKKVDMSGLGSAVESVQAKFSALDVVAVTALANITNSAVNAGKNLVKSLTIDQVTAGWNKYEQKTASVQTIMNATGKSIDEVNAYLDKLMWYSDETSYGFNDMTAAIAQMTSSGGDIEKLIPMVEGVANSVAFAGKGAAEFSRVMFNLNQSYGAGYLQLMDWRSVELAGAGSKQLKQVFIDTAVALGKLNKEGETAKGTLVTASNFSSTLSEKWATTEVMEQAFGRFAKVTEAAYEMVQDESNEIDNATTAYKVLSGELDKTSDEYRSLSESQKALVGTFSETEIAAAKSAQEAKSFSEAIEATKDAVSSGWMKTSELIFGNYEQSKKLWSDVTEQLWEIFASGGETRNDILTNVMTSGWEKIGKVVRKAGIETGDFEKKVTECAKAGGVDVDDLVKKYGSLSDAFRNGAIDTKYLKTAFDSLKDGAGGTSKVIDKLSVDLDSIFSGKDGKSTLGFGDSDHESVKKVQTALEELGFTLDKFGVDGLFGSETQGRLKEFQKSVGLEATGIVDQKTIDALKKAGQEVEALGESADGSKLSIDDLLDSVNKPSGRELVFDIIHNSLESIVSVLGTFRSAWADIFSEDRLSSGLYSALKGIRDFTEGIKSFITDEANVEKLTDSFKGLVAVFDVITSLAGGGVKLVFKSLSTILKAFNFNILGTTSNIGTLLVSFRNWVLEGDKIGKVVDWLTNQLSIGIEMLKGWGKGILDTFKNTTIFKAMSDAVTRLGLAFSLLKEGKLNFIDFVKEIGTFCSSLINAVPLFKTWTDMFNGWLESFKGTETFKKLSDAVTRLSLAFSLLKEGKLTIFDFVNEFGTFISSVIDAIPILKQWKDMFTGWIESFKNLPAVQQFVAAIQGMKEAFSKLLNGEIDFAKFGSMLGENLGKAIRAIPNIIKEAGSGIIAAAKQIGSDFIAGFKNGVVDSVSGIIGDIVQFALNFVSAFASALGVHSPSWKAYQIVKDFFQGAINGAKDALGPVLSVFQKIGERIVNVFTSLWDYITDESGKIEWGKLIAGGITIESLIILNSFAKSFEKVANALSSFGKIFDGVTKVLNSFSDVLQQFKKTLKAVNLDIIAGAAIKLAIAVGILVASIWALAAITDKYGYGKLWNAVGVIVVLCGIMAALAFALSKFSEANVSISKDGVNLKGLQTVLVQIGIAILLLAATAKLIGSMQPDQLKQGFIGLAGVAVGLILFIAAMGKISKAAGDADVSKLGTMMLKISAALIIMVIAMKMISKMDPADVLVGIAVLEAFVLFCVQLGIANRFAGQNGQNFGGNVLKIAIAMGALVIVMKMVAKMDPGDILKGIAVLQAFVILIGEMAIINRLAGGATSKIGGTVMSMATSMMILAGTLWLLSSMDESAVDNGIRVMQKFVLLIAELTVVSQLGRGATNIAANILAMSTAIGILAGIAVVLSLIPLEGLAKGIAAVGMLGAIMSLMIWATRGANDVKGNIIAMTVAIAVMAAAVVALSFIDSSKLAGSVAALGTLMVAFGIMMKLAGKAESSWKMVGAFTAMMGVVLALTGVIVILSQLDPKAALPNAIALGILLTAFAGALAIMGHAGKISTTVSKQLAPLTAVALGLALILAIMNGLNPVNAIANAVALGVLLNAMAAALVIMAAAGKISTTVSKQLGPLTAVVFGLAIILAMMNGLDPGKAIANAVALGILLNLMATALVIMGAAGKISTTVSSQLGPLTAVVAGLAIILGIMAALNVEASIPTAIALGILLNALAAAMVILGFAGPNASKAVPAVMLMAVVLAEIAFVLGILAKCEIQPSIETAVALSTLLLALSAACLIISLVPAPAAISGALGLAAFVGIIAGVVAALGALSKIPGFTELLADGGQALGLIGQAIGNFVGGIVNGVASGLVGIIPEIGAALADFATNVEPFISLVSGIDSGVIAGAGILAGAIVALTAADFIAGIESLFSFGQGSFASIGTQLAKFAEGAKQFVDVVKDIDPSAVDSVNSLSAMIMALTATDILSGLKEFFGGGSINFEEIGTNLNQFGDAVTSFSEKISGKIDTAAIQAATDAGNMLVALNSSLPRSGGWVQDIIGEKDFSQFATACDAFLQCIMDINATLSQGDCTIQTEKLSQLAAAGTQLSDLNNALPRSGGIAQDFAGEQDLSRFATAVTAFATCMIAINATLSDPNLVIQSDKMKKLATAGTQLSDLNNALPRSGGIAQDFAGEQDLARFGTACKAFADCMVKVNESISQEGFTVNLAGIDQLAAAGTQLSDLNNALPRSGGIAQDFAGEQDLSRFATAVTAFATCMIAINATLSDPNLVIQSDKMKKLATAGTQLSDLNNALPRSGGIAQDFAGEQDLARFGTACKAFADCMVKVNESISQEGFTVNLAGIDQLKQAGEKIKELQDVLPKSGGWWQEIAGEQDIGDFGTKIGNFATAITDFSTQAKGLDSAGIDLAIQTAYRIKNLAEVLQGIDYSGVTEFTGVGTGGFGADGPAYKIGKAIAAFGEQVAEIDTERVNTSVTAARQIRNLISSLAGLDASGVENFKPEDIGSAMKGYSDEVSGIDTSIVASSIASAVRLKNMIASLAEFDNSGVSKFNPGPIGASMRAYADNVGELDISTVSASISIANRLKTFVASLADFDNSGIWKFNVSQIGTSISSYAASVAELDYPSVSASISAANRLKEFVAGLAEFDNSGISKFNVSQIGSSLSAYAGSVSGLNMDAVSSSIAAANRLKVFITSLKDFDGSGVTSFKTAISELSKISINGLTDGFSNAASKLSTAGTQMISGLVKGMQAGLPSVKSASGNIVTAARNAIISKSSAFMSAGSALSSKLASGISKGKNTVSKSVETIVSGAADSIKDYQGDFYDAGSYLVDGLESGIMDNAQKVADAAAEMVRSAVEAAKDAADINSPSRVFMEVGSYIPAGFAIGIGMLKGKVEKSAAGMAFTAINTTRSAMTSVLDVLNSDVDSRPTIRPVVDLTDVRSGANSIGKLLNTESSVGVTTNLNAVNTMMRNRQNGSTNDDVVSAINKLRKDLGNVGNTTYTVGNITYDDGSNVSEAVKSLVRAARVERRV